MLLRVVFWTVVALYLLKQDTAASPASRQKRCIVIQKQSGTHGDSTEDGDDDEYRKPQPKEPKPDRLMNNKKQPDYEAVPPELLKYRMPANRSERLRFKKRFLKNYGGL